MSKRPTVNIRTRGQFVFVFDLLHVEENENPSIVFNDVHRMTGMKVEWMRDKIEVSLLNPPKVLVDLSNNCGFISKDVPYWFSMDAQNRRLYAGIGEPRLETAYYSYTFTEVEAKKMLENFLKIDFNSKRIHCLHIMKDPITRSIPLVVRDTDELTMEDIAKGAYMPKANLSAVSQKLYDCIAGKKFVLNSSDFPEFSDAIEYSIQTKGCWCNTTLQNKATEFNKDKPNIKETYLRITLGENNGESPGIPYVMEIWPSSHYSPIHSHAGADAVIRVLHGSIHVKLFPYLCPENKVLPFAEVDFQKDEITWISPALNQTHQLMNRGKETCITIQCYMYEGEDNLHYDYFDYLDGEGEIQPYEPDSDMDFLAFKELMQKEWAKK
jgi:hypothetical protein